MNRVLITGGSGFVGSHTIEPFLARGYEVHIVCSTADPKAAKVRSAVSRHAVDLHNLGETRALLERVKPSHLLHLAWFVKPGALVSSPDNLDWISASNSILRVFKLCGGRRFVGVGSCYEYNLEYGYCDEELTPLRPSTLYGASKNAFREVAEVFSKGNELEFAWARLFFLYGPNENPLRLVPAVVNSLLHGQEAKTSHGRQIRDYMHVQDAADGLVALVDSSEQGAFNIASGRPVEVRHVVKVLADELEKSDLLRIGALPTRADDVRFIVASTRKAEERLAFEPRLDLRAGLRHTLDWWRAKLDKSEKGII